RAANRGKGIESRGERCALSVRRARRALSRWPVQWSRCLLGARAQAHLESRAILVVDDDAAASPARSWRVRRQDPACRARVPLQLERGEDLTRGKLRRVAVLRALRRAYY